MDEKKLDSLLNEYLEKCYESAKEILQGCNTIELLRIAFMKYHEKIFMFEDYDEDFSTPEEAFEFVLEVNSSGAFESAAYEIMKKLPLDDNKYIN